MSLVAALTLSVGPAIAKSILDLWLKDSTIASSALGSIVDVLAKKTDDVWAQQRGKRQFEEIGEKVAEGLLPLFDEFPVDDAEKQAVAIAVAETLENTPLQAEILAKHDLDPSQLSVYLLTDVETVMRDFSEAGAALYRRNINEISAYVVDIASQLPSFTEQTFAELLKRDRQLLEVVETLLEEVRKIRDESVQANVEAAAARFEADYRRTVVRKLDELELFGVDVSNASRRHRLSVAYVTLSVEQKMSGELAEANARNQEENDGEDDEEIDTSITLSAHAALARTNRLLVQGAPGSGKTTLLKWVAVQSALRRFENELENWNNTIPFFIRLRQLIDPGLPQPQDFPALIAPMIADTMPQGWVHQQLEKGRAIVLIDGLDEVSEEMRNEVHDWVKDLSETYEASRFVISSRPHAVDEGWMAQEGFEDAELQPMERADVEIFIEHWHAAVREQLQDAEKIAEIPKMVANLKATLRQTRAIARLATNPLLCAMLCAIHHDQKQKLPEDRIELYEACCHMLLVRRDEEREVSLIDYPDMSYREKKMLLKHLAYWMIDNGHTMIEMTRADDRLAHKLPETIRLRDSDPSLVRDFFIQRSGMLREPLPNKIDFTHRTFQEYLAADAAVDEDNMGALIDHAHDVQWREVVPLAAGLGGKRQRQELIAGLIERGDAEEDVRHALHMLAVSCLDTATELDPQLQHEVQQRLASLIPPKNITEAKALAAAGELVVPYLQYDKVKRRAAEVVASIRTLSMIGGEAAEAVLEQYGDTRQIVIKELVKTDAGVRALTNLTTLDLNYTSISDVSELAKLTNLTSLYLSSTSVSDVSELAKLTNLTALYLSYTGVSDVSALANLSSLTTLNLNSTSISNVSALTNLINLNLLYLSGTSVSDVSELANLINLTTLDLRSTGVSDVSALTNLTSLNSLYLSYTGVSDVSALTNLTNLNSLDLSGTSVSDVSALTDLTNLNSLGLYNTDLSDVNELASLTNLNSLNLSGTSVSDVSELANLTNLNSLNLSGTSVSDVSELANLTNLNSLYLNYTSVSNVSELANLTNLASLNLSYTGVSDVSELADLTNLTTLDLSGTSVSDVSALNHLTKLKIYGL